MFFFPFRTDVPLRSTPWMNWLLILLNAIVFAVQLHLGESFTRHYELNPHHAILYQYITYAFLHGGMLHLASNMLFLYIFGNNINDRLGQLGYLGFYLAGAVIAGVAHVLTADNPVIGASGACFAVTGAFLVLFPRAHVSVFYWLILPGVIELASLWFIGLEFALNVVSEFSQFLGAQSSVATAAHIGGCVFGAAVCLSLLALRLLPRDQFDLLAMIDRWNRRRQYRGMVASGYDPFRTSVEMQTKFDPRGERIMELRAAVAEAMAHGKPHEAIKLFMEMRAIDPQQVLGRQNQLDLANYLFQEQQYPAAADAYEGFVRVYPKGDQIAHVMLMLGLMYARYLNRPDRAEPYLRQVIDRLQEGRDADLARDELAKITTVR